jgi:phenylacetic acid degradation operon negative regulatory protein
LRARGDRADDAPVIASGQTASSEPAGEPVRELPAVSALSALATLLSGDRLGPDGPPGRADVLDVSAPGAIPTRMMVLGVADETGVIHAGALARVAEACGISPEQVRSCLRRVVSEGLYHRIGAGRSARFEPTAKGLAVLTKWSSRTRWAWDLDSAASGWDGLWHLVGFGVPERQRSRRDSFRAALVRMGGASVHGGLYVSPHPWLDAVRARAQRIGVGEQVTTMTANGLTVGRHGDPRDIAASLWPVDELGGRYERFIETCTPFVSRMRDASRNGRHVSDAEGFAGAMSLAASFTEVFLDDPLLPLELLPHPWPGQAARALAAEGHHLVALQHGDGTVPFRRYEHAMTAHPA